MIKYIVSFGKAIAMITQNTTHERIKIAVGLSGGVDSSVAAALLKEQGHDVIGVHMVTTDVNMPGCRGNADRADALRVAKKLAIPFRVVDFRKQYQERVIDRFIAEYQQGRTPNPDIWCNEEIKFGLFLQYAVNDLRVDKIATGHYVRVQKRQGYQLLAGADKSKDQSYFLYRITQDQLARSVFPLGELQKAEVRKLAEKFDLPTAAKPDSVGICFIGDIDVREFLKSRLKYGKGDVVTSDGKVIGWHEGVQLYTIGQRHGFELTDYQGDPLYVIKKDVENNRLVVGRDLESDVDKFAVGDLFFNNSPEENWRDIISLDDICVRIRHLGELTPCELEIAANRKTINCKSISILRGVSPGQHAVFYQNEVVLGGGVIE